MTHLYDRPLWRDWIAWLTLFSFIAVFQGIAGNYGGLDAALATQFNRTAFFIDLGTACLFQFLVFGVLPCAIRRKVRQARTPEAAEQRAAGRQLKQQERTERQTRRLAEAEAEWDRIDNAARITAGRHADYMAGRSR